MSGLRYGLHICSFVDAVTSGAWNHPYQAKNLSSSHIEHRTSTSSTGKAGSQQKISKQLQSNYIGDHANDIQLTSMLCMLARRRKSSRSVGTQSAWTRIRNPHGSFSTRRKKTENSNQCHNTGSTTNRAVELSFFITVLIVQLLISFPH